MSVILACEGPRCNRGISAKDREAAIVAALPTQTGELRDEAIKQARLHTSRTLALTPHTALEVSRGGLLVYACDICGAPRVYGSRYWNPSPWEPAPAGPYQGGAVRE